MSCIAEHDLVTLPARGPKPRQIQFDGDVGDVRRFQDGRHEAADATAATQDDVVVEAAAFRTDRYFGRGDTAITMAERPFGPVVALYDERGETHREGQGNQHRLTQIRRHEAGLECQRDEEQSELAAMREDDGGSCRCLPVRSGDQAGHEDQEQPLPERTPAPTG